MSGTMSASSSAVDLTTEATACPSPESTRSASSARDPPRATTSSPESHCSEVSEETPMRMCGVAEVSEETPMRVCGVVGRRPGAIVVKDEPLGAPHSPCAPDVDADENNYGVPIDFLRSVARASLPQAQHVDAKGIAASE